MTYRIFRRIVAASGMALILCVLTARADGGGAKQKSRFDIVRFDVRGNSLLSASEIDLLLVPFAGKARDAGAVAIALETLEAAYTKKGHNEVRVVAVELDAASGVVPLQVLEIPVVGIDGDKQTTGASQIPRFDILRFEVSGNTLLPVADIAQLLTPYAGKAREFGSVQIALEALESAYKDKGYNIVQVLLPEQVLDRGVVMFQVIETHVGKVRVEGNQHFDEANIRRSVPGLRAGEAPNIADVSASLKLANENPAKKTTLQLQSDEQDDRVNAVLKVADEKIWTVSLGVDNTGDTNTGRNRMTVQYQNANIGALDHVMSLQYTTSMANPSRVSVYGAGYHIPLYALGDSLDFFGSYSNVNSGTVSAGAFELAVSGKGTVFGSRYNHSLAKMGDYESKLIFGIDYKAFKNDVSFLGQPLGNDITVHPLSVTYAGNWAASGNAVNFYIGGFRNIPGGEHGGGSDFNIARAGAPDTYSLLRYGASYMHIFAADWQLRLAQNGQVTSAALVPGEQFGAGGASSVRGFNERVIANDQGSTDNLELYTPNLCDGTTQCRLLSFYDYGHVSHNHRLPGELSTQTISSAGFGMRMSVEKNLTAQLDYARVIDTDTATPKGSHRLQFKVLVSY